VPAGPYMIDVKAAGLKRLRVREVQVHGGCPTAAILVLEFYHGPGID
jgi:hypothetical protein